MLRWRCREIIEVSEEPFRCTQTKVALRRRGRGLELTASRAGRESSKPWMARAHRESRPEGVMAAIDRDTYMHAQKVTD